MFWRRRRTVSDNKLFEQLVILGKRDREIRARLTEILCLPPGTRRAELAVLLGKLRMRGAPDDRIAGFLWGLVLDQLLVAQAESAGVRLSEGAYGAMAQEVRDAVHALWEHTGLAPSALSSAGPAPADRATAAARKVEEYLEAAAARKVPLEAVPPFLAVPLLREVEWEIAADRMHEVVDRARRLLAATESPRTS